MYSGKILGVNGSLVVLVLLPFILVQNAISTLLETSQMDRFYEKMQSTTSHIIQGSYISAEFGEITFM